MEDRKIAIEKGANFVEGYVDAFQVLYNTQKGLVEMQLCEEIPIMPTECKIDEDGSLAVIIPESEYIAKRIVNARFKMPMNAAWKLAELLLASKPAEKDQE